VPIYLSPQPFAHFLLLTVFLLLLVSLGLTLELAFLFVDGFLDIASIPAVACAEVSLVSV
jgi:hypothetical protein